MNTDTVPTPAPVFRQSNNELANLRYKVLSAVREFSQTWTRLHGCTDSEFPCECNTVNYNTYTAIDKILRDVMRVT